MPGRDPKQAVDSFLAPLNESTACVLPATWSYHKPRDGKAVGGHYTALLNWGRPVEVQGITIQVEGSIPFTVIEQDINKRGEKVPRSQRFKVKTKSYWYTLARSNGAGEVVAYHWHPEAKGEVLHPHLHIGTGELNREGVLSRRNHMPSGRMSFEEVLVMLVDLGAEPLRADWEATVNRNLETFQAWRTWP